MPIKRLRFLTARSQFAGASESAEVTFLPMEAIGDQGDLDLSNVRRSEDVQSGYSRFRDGDVVIAKITPCFENGKGALIRGTLTGIGYGTTELHVLTPGPEVDGHFLYYVTMSPRFRNLGQASMTGAAGQQRVPEEFVRDFRIPVPPLSQQRTIANYLDCETSRLDALVAAKERLLELLAEKRRALITRSVTRGLDPRARLRDSGIPWLGEIPAHWETGSIRRFATMKTGHTPDRKQTEYWRDCEIPWFTLADVWQLRNDREIYLRETKERISELGLRNSAAEFLPAGTVIFSRTASIGFSGIMPLPMATTQDFWNWIPGSKLSSEYLLYVFRAMRPEFERLAFGSTHRTIYQPEAASLQIAVPPLKEQRVIVDYIARETAKLDLVREATERTITLLKERRSALIAAAVTGKIDVEGPA
ncbi:MAG: restriction endonuclease subunit S [Blastocatellales bacterium]|nr:restriction endonuclease subunit S [Blastocatellales bacterium]